MTCEKGSKSSEERKIIQVRNSGLYEEKNLREGINEDEMNTFIFLILNCSTCLLFKIISTIYCVIIAYG